MALPWAGTLEWKIYTVAVDKTSGSPVLSATPEDMATVEVGMIAVGSGVPAGAKVTAVNYSTGDITLDQNATNGTDVDVEFFFRYQFEFPPRTDTDDQDKPTETVQTSLSGIQQVQTFYIEVTRTILYDFLTRADRDLLRVEFFQKWALLGKSFRYRDDETNGSFETYQLDLNRFQNSRTVKKHPTFLYSITFPFRRVL